MNKWFHRKESCVWEWHSEDFSVEILRHEGKYLAYASDITTGETFTFTRNGKQATWASAQAAQKAALRLLMEKKREIY